MCLMYIIYNKTYTCVVYVYNLLYGALIHLKGVTRIMILNFSSDMARTFYVLDVSTFKLLFYGSVHSSDMKLNLLRHMD